MAKPDRTLNLALANLRRAWPATLPSFGSVAMPPSSAASSLLTSDEAMRLGLVAAHRTTCELSIDRFERFLESPAPRTLIVHAVDAEPAVPLLALWAMEQTAVLASLATRWTQELACEVIFALPLELPDAAKRSLPSLTPVRWVDGNYPGGHWRLLPRAARVRSHALTIDVVAATDWAHAMATGSAAIDRPIAVAQRDAAKPDFAIVARGLHLAALTNATSDDDPLSHPANWFAGPRLADRAIGDDEAIGDGELTFYRESRGDRPSSTCIRCGHCIAVCPTRVDPVALLRESVFARHDQSSDRKQRRAGIDACIECGLCTATCPCGIELHHVIAGLRSERGHA